MYVAECVVDVSTRIFTADAPSYAVIMQIDLNIREFPILDPVALIFSSISSISPPLITEESSTLSWAALVMSHSRENGKLVLLYSNWLL